eukprot:scaffold50362_cov44-Phaeocystis_antarctica.AAC.4
MEDQQERGRLTRRESDKQVGKDMTNPNPNPNPNPSPSLNPNPNPNPYPYPTPTPNQVGKDMFASLAEVPPADKDTVRRWF